jgi:DNA methylase
MYRDNETTVYTEPQLGRKKTRHDTTLHCWSVGSVTLYQGDCKALLPWLNLQNVTLCTDPPYTIRTAQHVKEMIDSLQLRNRMNEYIVLTNPEHGYIRGGLTHTNEALKPIAATGLKGQPHIERPLNELIDLLQHTEGTILDPYAGTGTTLLAALSLNRTAIGIEIDPKRCAHIFARLKAIASQC